MAWLPVAAAGIQAGGSLLGGVLGAGGAAATNAQSIQASQANLAQQENYNTDMFNRQVELANTAYTRAVADMKNAGLNPILAASYGGASTPSAMGVNPQMPTLQNPSAAIQSGMQSASQAGMVYQQIKGLQATADKDSAGADLNKAQVGSTQAQTENLKGQNANITKEGDRIDADAAARRAAGRASDASAGASAADAALSAAKTVTEMHNATSAKQRAERDAVTGAPKGSELGRTIQDVGGWLGRVIDFGGQPGRGVPSVSPNSAKGYSVPPAAPYYRDR